MIKFFYNIDFASFPIGELPYDKECSAIGEYNYVEKIGYMGDFYDPISNHQWRSQGGSWLITSDGEKHFLEQNRGDYSKGAFANVYSALVLKNIIYANPSIEFNIRLFDLNKYCGIGFCYQTSRDYYAIFLNGEEIALVRRYEEDIKVLISKKIKISDLKTYNIKIETENDIIKVCLDNELQFEYKIEYIFGRIGFIAKGACRYSDLKIYASCEEYLKHENRLEAINNNLIKKRKKYPRLKCIKKIDLKNFGSARQLRIGRFNDGKIFFILCQHQKRIMRDSFARLSSITAFDIDGNILWQKGEPNNSFDSTAISCDLPIQIADVNNDGNLEVIYAMDFMIYIVDARNGNIIKSMPTPVVGNDPLVGEYPFNRLNVDAIRVADFSGLGYKSDFIIKDRYKNVWAYNKEFQLLWRYNHKNTGHFPYIFDYDNDGCDEMFVGYDLIDHDGKMLFSLPMNSDHTDEIIYTKLAKEEEEKFILASGNEGFNIFNKDGSLYKHNEIGHAQRISTACYERNSNELKIAVTTFWGSEGIVLMYDRFGNLHKKIEQMSNGNIISPVAYDGVNELCLLNASPDGGLVDYDLDKVVLFPDDGHPTLACEVYDIDNDGVDEIITFDQNKMWIYKAESFKSGNSYQKYPDTGFSNYRGEYLIKISNKK